jgi:hypothetical protein
MKKLFVALIFILALIGVLYFAQLVPNEPVAMPGAVPETTGGETSQTTSHKIQEETSSYKIDVEYVLFGNPVIDPKVEAAVKKSVDAFKADAASFDPEVMTRPYTFSGQAVEFYSHSTISSERINLYQDTGGAHGLPIVLTLNYDTTTGADVTQEQALALIGKSLTDVAAVALNQLKQEFGEGSVFVDGATPKKENYATFLVTPQNVTFIFQPYQVVAYAAGMPEVTFARVDQ